ncbi:hypothetical protein [Actinomyces faecalis]|uniref:hypothetical protein n=1 Tax=Actinomyces faecalis TaxID=2722820 RepID=UPI0015541FE0|nr:hypothetical protein [Actinomyces faecalis]
MRLCSSPAGKIIPFFRAETPHAAGCDEGAWNTGPEVVAAFDALREGRDHSAGQWLEALAMYLQAGCSAQWDVYSYLAQWAPAQWQAWADYRNALATGSAYEAPCIPEGLSRLLGFPVMPADMTASFPYLGFICCGVQDLVDARHRLGSGLIVSSALFGGPTLPGLLQARRRVSGVLEPGSWWLEATVLLLPQPSGHGVLAEVSEVLLSVRTDNDCASAGADLDGLFPHALTGTCTCCGTRTWRWE